MRYKYSAEQVIASMAIGLAYNVGPIVLILLDQPKTALVAGICGCASYTAMVRMELRDLLAQRPAAEEQGT